jgi:hypothetical protein
MQLQFVSTAPSSLQGFFVWVRACVSFAFLAQTEESKAF